MSNPQKQPDPVITPEFIYALISQSTDQELIERLAMPKWYPTTSIRKSFDDIEQLWVLQRLRIGDAVPFVSEWEWRKVPQVMGAS